MNIQNIKLKLSGITVIVSAIFISVFSALAPIGQASANAPVVNLCLAASSNGSECIVTEGQGRQVQLGASGYGKFTLAEVGTSIWYRLTDANGNCLRETSSNVVEIGNGACSSSDEAAEWDWFTSNGTNKFRNRGQDNGNDYMGTYGTNSTRPVWAYPQANNFYAGWLVQVAQ